MAIETYINFSGNCREAVEFYAGVFGTEQPKIMLYGDAPAEEGHPLTEETKKLVMHTELKIKGSTVMFSDVPPGMPFTVGNNISLVFVSDDLEEIQFVFNRLKAGGTVTMDLQETFWSKAYGFVTDKYGVGWQLSYGSKE